MRIFYRRESNIFIWIRNLNRFFISYHTETGKDAVRKICAALEGAGISCWYAPRNVGANYAQSIVEAIRECRVFLLVLNEGSNVSAHVLNEINCAFDRFRAHEDITLLPFRIDQCTLSDDIYYYLGRIHIMDGILPPELLRKGRFDEIFYVGLPDRDEQRKIFEIHIKKRRPKDLQSIQIDKLLDCAKGCSGADIEGIVRESVERAFAGGKQVLTTKDLQEAIKNTHPLSEIMKDTIEKMQKEYETRKFKTHRTKEVSLCQKRANWKWTALGFRKQRLFKSC